MVGGAAGGRWLRLRQPRLITERLWKIGVVGVYEPSDEGAATEDAKQGRYDFDYGTAFTKGIIIGSGQCPVMRYNRWLSDLIIRGQATPSRVISHELPLDQVGRAYDQFDKRAEGWTKVWATPPPGQVRLTGSGVRHRGGETCLRPV